MVSRLTGYVGAAEQGDRRAQRLRARVRHPPGRRAQGAHDLRDHGRARRSAWTSNSIVLGKHSGRHALQRRAGGARLRGRGQRAEHRPSSASRRSPTRRSRSPRSTWRRSSPTRCASAPEAYELAWFEVEAGSRREPRGPGRRSRLPAGEEVESASQAATGRSTRSSARSRRPSTPSASCASTTVEVGDRRRGRARRGHRDARAPHGRLATGQGVATDILEASARAYVRALSNASRAPRPRGGGGDRRRRLGRVAVPSWTVDKTEHPASSGRGPTRRNSGGDNGLVRHRRGDRARARRGGRERDARGPAGRADRRPRRTDPAAGGKAVAIETDITDEAQANAFVERATRNSGASTSSSTTPV